MPVVVLHTTESDPGTCEAVAQYLVRMGYEPHEVFDPSNGDGVILLPKTSSGKALMNLPGGVETNNRGGVYQIEIVGRAVDVPGYDDDWYARLRTRLVEVCDFTGTPHVFPLPFQPYPQSYGNNLVRMSYDEWLVFEGICGHMHVPENDHGDPGALDIERLAMALSDDDVKRIVEAVWARPLDIEGETHPAAEWFGYMYAEITRTEAQGGKLMRNINDALSGGSNPGNP